MVTMAMIALMMEWAVARLKQMKEMAGAFRELIDISL